MLKFDLNESGSVMFHKLKNAPVVFFVLWIIIPFLYRLLVNNYSFSCIFYIFMSKEVANLGNMQT